MKANFIRVFDKDIADRLINNGYQLIDKNRGSWLFINQNTLKFSDEENEKVIYTNILTI